MNKHYTRMEVIDPNGRQVVYYGNLTASIQDDERTIKLFLNDHLNSIVTRDELRDCIVMDKSIRIFGRPYVTWNENKLNALCKKLGILNPIEISEANKT